MTGGLAPAVAIVVVLDAALLATGVIGPAAALALFLAVEVPLVAIAVSGYARRYRLADPTDSSGPVEPSNSTSV